MVIEKPRARLALAVTTGVLLVVIFPGPGVTWLAPVALVPLLVALEGEKSARRRYLLGLVAGTVSWAGLCYWMYYTLTVHGRMSAPLASTLFAAFCVGKGMLHLGVFGVVAGPLLRDRKSVV